MAIIVRSGYSAGMSITAQRQGSGWIADASTFGARLALIRQRMGWGNIAKAAKACDIAIDSWRNWEVDGREPHRMTTIAKQIAGATGCDYLWLVHGPDRGQGGEPRDTHEYFDQARLIATIGAGDHRSSRRPVTRTRPIRATRPRTPVAA